LIAFLLYIYIFNVDIPRMIATLKNVNPFVYSLAIVTLILGTFFFSLSWRCLLNYLSVKLSVVKSLLYVWYGIFIDIMIPAESISGEISRVYLVTREKNGTSGKVIASLVAHRLMGTGINTASLIIGIGALFVRRQITGILLNLILLLIAGTTIFLVLLILLCIKEKWTLKIIDAAIRFVDYISRGRWKLTNVRGRIVKATRIFHNSMKEFAHAPKTLSVSILLHLSSWFCNVGVAYLVFLSLGFPIPWSVAIITNSIMIAIKGIPLGVPFEAGLPELTMPTLYTALLTEADIPLSIRATICATATILIRILTVWLRFLIGFAVQQSLGIRDLTTTLDVANKTEPEAAKT
jgi:uncharacterized protein (TIRG00374 family)